VKWTLALKFTAVAAFLATTALVARASADIQRFAVIAGDDRGDGADAALRYAESDASKVYDVLKDLGGFDPANMVLLRGETGPTLVRTLITINDRVRAAMSRADMQVVLFVYYSGHADATALHPAGTRVDLTQLEQLVRGSAATVRVLMLDSCRSGALTRIKGGAAAPPFPIDLGDRLSGEGLVYLTSSSGNEDAQESDELKGSFFTHHFVSALLGAGDADHDGRVTLEEAYKYAFDATLRSTSRTWAGLQHPAFRYDLRGEGKLVLTTLAGVRSPRATLAFPADRTYLVLQDSAAGPVVAEVDSVDRARRISVKPGRYFIRGRLPDALIEGEVVAAADEYVTVVDANLHRTEYARLVRKGGTDVRVSHGVQAGYLFRTPMKNAATLCQGGFAGYTQHWSSFDVGARVDGCAASAANQTLTSRDDEVGGELRAARSWDLPFVTLGVGLGLGASWLHQSFTTLGLAPPRDSVAGRLSVSVSLSVPVTSGVSVVAESAGLAYVFEQLVGNETQLGPWFSFRQMAGLEKEW
jgi:hypothetical protein